MNVLGPSDFVSRWTGFLESRSANGARRHLERPLPPPAPVGTIADAKLEDRTAADQQQTLRPTGVVCRTFDPAGTDHAETRGRSLVRPTVDRNDVDKLRS